MSGHAGGLDKAIKDLIERIERTGTLLSPKTRVNTAKRDEVARSEHSSSSNTFDRYTAVSVSIWTMFGESILNCMLIGYNAALRDKSEWNSLEFSCLYFYDLFLNFYPRTREPSNHAIMQCLGALAESRRSVGLQSIPSTRMVPSERRFSLHRAIGPWCMPESGTQLLRFQHLQRLV